MTEAHTRHPEAQSHIAELPPNYLGIRSDAPMRQRTEPEIVAAAQAIFANPYAADFLSSIVDDNQESTQDFINDDVRRRIWRGMALAYSIFDQDGTDDSVAAPNLRLAEPKTSQTLESAFDDLLSARNRHAFSLVPTGTEPGVSELSEQILERAGIEPKRFMVAAGLHELTAHQPRAKDLFYGAAAMALFLGAARVGMAQNAQQQGRQSFVSRISGNLMREPGLPGHSGVLDDTVQFQPMSGSLHPVPGPVDLPTRPIMRPVTMPRGPGQGPARQHNRGPSIDSHAEAEELKAVQEAARAAHKLDTYVGPGYKDYQDAHPKFNRDPKSKPELGARMKAWENVKETPPKEMNTIMRDLPAFARLPEPEKIAYWTRFISLLARRASYDNNNPSERHAATEQIRNLRTNLPTLPEVPPANRAQVIRILDYLDQRNVAAVYSRNGLHHYPY